MENFCFHKRQPRSDLWTEKSLWRKHGFWMLKDAKMLKMLENYSQRYGKNAGIWFRACNQEAEQMCELKTEWKSAYFGLTVLKYLHVTLNQDFSTTSHQGHFEKLKEYFWIYFLKNLVKTMFKTNFWIWNSPIFEKSHDSMFWNWKQVTGSEALL